MTVSTQVISSISQIEKKMEAPRVVAEKIRSDILKFVKELVQDSSIREKELTPEIKNLENALKKFGKNLFNS